MAKKKAARQPAPGKKRYRRSDQEMIEDLKAKIDSLKARADTKRLKSSPSMKRTLNVVRNIDKGLDEAKDEGNSTLRHALAAARKPLAEFLETEGVRLPKPRLPRGRKPRK